MYQLILVDDEPWALTGLEELVDWAAFGFQIAATFTDAREAIAAIRHLRPDAVFTDIRMPHLSGLDMMRQLRREGHPAEFVITSAYRDFEVAKQAICFDVCQYVLKPYEQDEVEDALRRLAGLLARRRKALPIPVGVKAQCMDDAQQRLLEEAATYPNCYVVIGDDPQQAAPSLAQAHSVPISIAGFPVAWLLSTQAREGSALAVHCQLATAPHGLGVSPAHASFDAIDRMIDEALASLDGSFAYTDDTLADEVKRYLYQHLAESISLQQVAAAFHLSEAHLSHTFKKRTGRTVTGFMQHIRIHSAARALARTDRDLSDIAYSVGYADYNYFGRLFKRHFGQSPESYRAATRA